MNYIAIMKVNADTNRVEKYLDFSTQEEAEAHVQSFIGTYPLAYSVAKPSDATKDWLCDTSAKSISIDVLVDPDAFKNKRMMAYLAEFNITDQLDMQYHDLVDGTTTWKDAVKAIKDAHPKP